MGRDGKVTYRAQVRRKRGQETLYSEAKTFGRRGDAQGWMDRMEKALNGCLDVALLATRPSTLGDVIEFYLCGDGVHVGKTRRQCPEALREDSIATIGRSAIRGYRPTDLTNRLWETTKPQTVGKRPVWLL